MESLFGKFNDGGPFFTYPILILLIVILALIVQGLMNRNDNKKTISLISSFGWFTVAWGFLGRTFGLIKAFDMIAAQGELTPRLMADGLKMALIDPLFGITVFLIARAGIILLIWLSKEKAA
jgi:cytochrome c biogenesis factor